MTFSVRVQVGLTFLLSTLVATSSLHAATASSASFQLQSQSTDTAGGLSASGSYGVSSCLGGAVVGQSSSTSFRLDAGCAALSAILSVSPPINGVCASPVASVFAPVSADLCTTGTPSNVVPGSPWTWSCSGVNGGVAATCSSPNTLTSSGTGFGHAVLSGTSGWIVDPVNTGWVSSVGQGTPPGGYSFPHGLFKVRLTSGPSASSAIVTLTYPSNLPPGTVYFKYGPTQNNTAPHWYVYPNAVISGNTVTLTLTDGADGDTDLSANQIIVDPGGPAVLGGASEGIPTLNEWAMLLLAGLIGFLAVGAQRRHRISIHWKEPS